jgi:putative copper export protein
MIMPACLRRFALTAHVTSSVGWMGGLAVVLVSLRLAWCRPAGVLAATAPGGASRGG